MTAPYTRSLVQLGRGVMLLTATRTALTALSLGVRAALRLRGVLTGGGLRGDFVATELLAERLLEVFDRSRDRGSRLGEGRDHRRPAILSASACCACGRQPYSLSHDNVRLGMNLRHRPINSYTSRRGGVMVASSSLGRFRWRSGRRTSPYRLCLPGSRQLAAQLLG